MADSNHQDIMDRLRKVERENRAMRFAAGTMLCAGMTALLLGQATGQSGQEHGQILEAEEIRLRDANGKLRIRLTARDGSELSFFDGTGMRRLWLSAGKEGSAINMYSEDGLPRFGVLTTEKTSELILFGEKRTPRVWIQAQRSGSASGGFYDIRGKVRISLGTSKDDTGLTLYDETGAIRAVLGTTSKMVKKRSESSLVLLDKGGEMVWETPGD